MVVVESLRAPKGSPAQGELAAARRSEGSCLRRPPFFVRTQKWGKESRQGSARPEKCCDSPLGCPDIFMSGPLDPRGRRRRPIFRKMQPVLLGQWRQANLTARRRGNPMGGRRAQRPPCKLREAHTPLGGARGGCARLACNHPPLALAKQAPYFVKGKIRGGNGESKPLPL